MACTYDAEFQAAFYDAYGDREWTRFESPDGRGGEAVHLDLLAEFVRPGDLVFDAGAGPGRFTIELARLGATVHVGDLSPVQLAANERRVAEAGRADAVVARELLDICDLRTLPDARFDVTVCFGGPLSYVRDRAPDALAELVRVTRPGGHVLLGVMSSMGTMRAFLPGVLEERRLHGAAYIDGVLDDGELDRRRNGGHEMHMFRWAELERLCAGHGEIVAAAAANFLTANPDKQFYADLTDEEWADLLRWERRVCREPGLLDAGTHLLVALRRPERTAEEAVLAAATARADALGRSDADALRDLLHPRFRWTSHRGAVLDREAYLRSNTAGSLRWHGQRVADAQVVVEGDTAVLHAVAVDDVDPGDGRRTLRMPMTQTWVRVAGRWLCLAGHAGPGLDA